MTVNSITFNFLQPILERNFFPKLEVNEKISEIIINFSEKTYLNSVGIRDWIKWLVPIKDNKLIKIKLFNCPPSIINQVNLINNFLPDNAYIESFFVQFTNADGTESKSILMKKEDVFINGKIILPTVKDSKGEIMEIDISHKYFRFLNKI